MHMKVFRITTEINRSSIGRTSEQIGELVINEGWESYIAWGRSDGESTSYKIKIGDRWSVLFHGLISRLFDLHGHGSYFATKELVRKMKKIKPDIVHLHDIHGYYINLKVLFKYLRESNVPVVWTHHDCWAFTGHCAFYSSIGCEKWKTGCNHCPNIRCYPSSLFVDNSKCQFAFKKELFTSINRLFNVGVSEWESRQLKMSFLKNTSIRTICNGIDTDIFRPQQERSKEVRKKYNLGGGAILLGVATAWGERKGLSDYYKLRERLRDDYTIVLVGVSQSQKEALPKGIIGILRTDSIDELSLLYSSASIVMNLANAESFGKTTPEGLACGTPSIVYNCTASPDLVDDKTGIVVEKGNIDALESAVYAIMSWSRDDTIHYCRERAITLYDAKKNWQMYIELYKEIASMYTME